MRKGVRRDGLGGERLLLTQDAGDSVHAIATVLAQGAREALSDVCT